MNDHDRPMRVLFVAFSRSSLGHITRMRTAAERFASAGHEVAVAAHAEVRELVLKAGLPWIAIDEIDPAPAWRGIDDVERLRAFVRTRLASPEYVANSLRDELRAIDDFGPDVVVSDMRNTASVAASMRDLPSFTCHNLRLFRHPLNALLPELLVTLEQLGVGRFHARKILGDVVLVPDLPLLDPLSDIPEETAALVSGMVSEIRHIGPLVAERLRTGPIAADRPPLLHLTLGGSGGGDKDLLRAVAAARDLRIPMAVTLGVEGPESETLSREVKDAAAGAEIDVATFRHDAADLTARATAAVLHGGHSSMMEALLNATPMMFMPHSEEQRGNAARIAALGLGAVVGPDDPLETVTAKLVSVLETPDADAHAAFAGLLRSADGAESMLERVERAVRIHRIRRGLHAR